MYNIIHMATSRGVGDARRHPRPAVEPSHEPRVADAIVAAPRRRRWRRRRGAAPSPPHPTGP